MTKSHRIKATEMGRVSCMSAYYLKFYFPHAYMRPFLPINYKRLQNVSNMVTKQRQIEPQNALCNFSKSPHMCRSPGYMAWCIMRLVHFTIYMACGLALVSECGSLGCLYVLGLRGRLESESVSVFEVLYL